MSIKINSIVKIIIKILLVVFAIPIIFAGLALMFGFAGDSTSDGSSKFFLGSGLLLWGSAMIHLCDKNIKLSSASWYLISTSLILISLYGIRYMS